VTGILIRIGKYQVREETQSGKYLEMKETELEVLLGKQ
jgi:hypothetical protein